METTPKDQNGTVRELCARLMRRMRSRRQKLANSTPSSSNAATQESNAPVHDRR